MSARNEELDPFLNVVAHICHEAFPAGEGIKDRLSIRRALADSGVLDLGTETYEMEDALTWLSETVTIVARRSPSLALVLASRYAAQRLGVASGLDLADAVVGLGSSVATLGQVHGDEVWTASAAIPTQFEPSAVALLDLVGRSGSVAARADMEGDGVRRLGLADAKIEVVSAPVAGTKAVDSEAATRAARDYILLLAAACLGTAEAAVNASDAYAQERMQFGAALTSFAGVRSILAAMIVRVAAVRSLLLAAIEAQAAEESLLELAAVAGGTAVDVALDAIQVHGGYGYIDEYAVAGLLRDAVGLQARMPARRSALAGVAQAHWGPCGSTQAGAAR